MAEIKQHTKAFYFHFKLSFYYIKKPKSIFKLKLVLRLFVDVL